jgi:DNA replication ATP-dependent helicase Dna2
MSGRTKAVFVDTDLVPGHDSRAGDLVQNLVEAELVRQVTETLLQSGISEEQIGILTLYRQQIKVIRNLLPGREGVEILTADRSQGRDKECVIISMVRSNDTRQVSRKVPKVLEGVVVFLYIVYLGW